MNLLHWNYFLALEDDVEKLSRFIEFSDINGCSNLDTYSIETLRILMLATQEVDVLLKLICNKYGDTSTSEQGYRSFVPAQYKALPNLKVEIPRYSLNFIPFVQWNENLTPDWWTANNKNKHERNTFFNLASLNNSLNALSALFLINVIYHLDVKQIARDEIYPNPKLFYCQPIIKGITPDVLGNISTYNEHAFH